jgi:hypothetical protein
LGGSGPCGGEVAGAGAVKAIALADALFAPVEYEEVPLSFDEEVRIEVDMMMAEFPEMDRGVARGQAIGLVKERRKAAEERRLREDGLAPVQVGVQGPAMDLEKMKTALGLKKASELGGAK